MSSRRGMRAGCLWRRFNSSAQRIVRSARRRAACVRRRHSATGRALLPAAAASPGGPPPPLPLRVHTSALCKRPLRPGERRDPPGDRRSAPADATLRSTSANGLTAAASCSSSPLRSAARRSVCSMNCRRILALGDALCPALLLPLTSCSILPRLSCSCSSRYCMRAVNESPLATTGRSHPPSSSSSRARSLRHCPPIYASQPAASPKRASTGTANSLTLAVLPMAARRRWLWRRGPSSGSARCH
mmetsp:Transcript_3204/g.8901  ORF Transcript_3204/g.8901 Transcript_3204/m.8901 type:complete len:245 (-) Transcript_3204:36-770(-)